MKDYRARYDLHKTIESARDAISGMQSTTRDLVHRVTSLSVDGKNYSVGPSNGFVQLGRQGMTVTGSHQDEMMVLDVGNKSLVALSYVIFPSREDIGVLTIQSLYNVSRQQYRSAHSLLGQQPHEFLFVHFLARLVPVLESHTSPVIRISPKKKPIYHALRRKYCTHERLLDATKEPVLSIFGEEHPWIKLH